MFYTVAKILTCPLDKKDMVCVCVCVCVYIMCVCVYTHHKTLLIQKNNKILSFAMDLEDIKLSEIIQRKTNSLFLLTYGI